MNHSAPTFARWANSGCVRSRRLTSQITRVPAASTPISVQAATRKTVLGKSGVVATAGIANTNPAARTQVSVFLEVEGAAHYLPAYAGNLDIMTSAALRVGERLAGQAHRTGALPAAASQ